MISGFSFAECLATLAVIAVLTIIAASYGGKWLSKQQSARAVEQLVQDLQFARQQAIIRKTVVTLCPTTVEPLQCSKSPEDWQTYTAFVDPQKSAAITDDTEILLTTKMLDHGALSNSRNYIQFDANGFSHATNSTFIYRERENEYRVIINLTGRIRVEEE